MNFSGAARGVGRIGGQVAEKGLIFALFDKGHGFVKENVLVAFAFHAFAVADEGRQSDRGDAGIGRAPVETTLFGAVCDPSAIFQSSRSCTYDFQELGEKNRILVQFLTGNNGMGDPVAKLVHACQGAARVGEQEDWR